MATQLADSGLIGDARAELEATLATQTSQNIATLTAAMTTKVTNEIKAAYIDKLTKTIEDKKSAIALDVADKIKAVTEKASKLTDAELEAVKSKTEGKVAEGMASWKAGKLEDPEAPASVQKAAAEQAQQELNVDGASEADLAQMASKISELVAAQLPGKLQAKVNGKMMDAESKAIEEIKNKLTAESQTKLQADIARETAGKDATETATITNQLTPAATEKLNQDITAATTSGALVALKSKLQNDLTEELRPSVQAELKAEITRQQTAELTKDKAEQANNQVQAVANAAGGDEDSELGSTLDTAESFSP
jgi:hypothetical protein